MIVEKLPRKTKWLWQIRFAVINFIIIALCVYFYASYKFLIYAGIGITAICLFTILFYIPLFVRSYRIRCTNGGVVINRGVIIKTTHIMPYSKLIYTQTFTTPLAKIFGLKALTLKAARSRILVPELPEADAETLLKILAEGEIK